MEEMEKDAYSLWIDFNGDCTTEEGFSYDDPDIVALASTDPNYVVHIDDDTPDADSPASQVEQKGRYRLRKIRAYNLKNMIQNWQNAQTQYHNNQVQSATAYMWGLWLAQQLGW